MELRIEQQQNDEAVDLRAYYERLKFFLRCEERRRNSAAQKNKAKADYHKDVIRAVRAEMRLISINLLPRQSRHE